MRFFVVLILAGIFIVPRAGAAPFPDFKEHAVNPDAGTGLAVTVADINADGKPDIVGVSSKDVAWYENPTWERHLIADTIRNSNVCVAPYDLDGDGVPELALGADWQYNNTESGGALFLLRHGGDVKQPWEVIALLEEEPTLHRIRWADLDGNGKKELVVAPLKGVGSTGPEFMDVGVKLFALFPGEDPFQTPWREEIISTDLHILHNIWPWRKYGQEVTTLITASMEGLTEHERTEDGSYRPHRLHLDGQEPAAPGGAGEIKTALTNTEPLLAVPTELYATIEPWHGNQAVMYTSRINSDSMKRVVLDDQLKGGHAVWFADFNHDGMQDVLIGFREKAGAKNLPGLNIYELAVSAQGNVVSTKHIIDDGGMATEDALAHDMNSDGWPDVVAFGRATQNIKYYENLGTE